MTTTSALDEMTVSFPGGKRVEATYGELRIPTDQPPSNGGEGSAPAPFDLFLASLATCAGYYVLAFCQGRDIPTAGVALRCRWQRDPERHRVSSIRLEVVLPEAFPKKYERAVVRAAERCAVKEVLLAPPRVELGVVR
jgi:ribosomal protein S12 methylthiotransferase accessory factor